MPWPNGRSLLVAILLAAAVAASGAAAVRDSLYGVHAVDASTAWAVGTFGSIYRTADGGRTWTPVDSGTRQPLFAIDFARGGTRGWAVGKSALILTTADGGKTWQKQKSPIASDKHLFKVQALDERTAWAVGDWGAMAVTRDGGATWEDRSLGTTTVAGQESRARTANVVTDDVILYDVTFPDARTGYVCGEFGTVLATTDGGATWTARRTPTEKTLFGLYFPTPSAGWAVGMDGLVMHTDDGGRSWTVQHGRPDAAAVDEISFVETMKNPGIYAIRVDGRTGVAVGDVGLLLVSDDGGHTWSRRELPNDNALAWVRDVDLVPGARGFMVGGDGFNAIVDGATIAAPAAGARPTE